MNDIDEQAVRWVARLDRGALSAADDAALDAWLAEDARHRGAFAKARAVMLQFDKAKALGPDFDPAAPDVGETRPWDAPSRRSLLRWAGGGAALAASVAAGALLPPARNVSSVQLATRRGEVRRVALEDGSSVLLNTMTTLELRFDGARRHVLLREGEATFDVARDPRRPFVVAAAGVEFQAIGTSFNVRNDATAPLQLVVQEGVVQVTAGRDAPIRAPADTIVEAQGDRSLRARTVSAAELQRRLAWQQGTLSFSDDTLEDAAREFARYSSLRIVVDPQVARRRIAGIFAASNPAGFARGIALSLGLQVEEQQGMIRLLPPVKDRAGKTK